MNYSLFGIKSYVDQDYEYDVGEYVYYDVVLNENNMYWLPTVPKGLSSWSYLSYNERDHTIKIASYEENKWYDFQINKIVVKKL